jgi:hypothetical protein
VNPDPKNRASACGQLSDMRSRSDLVYSLRTNQKDDIHHQQEEDSATDDDEDGYSSEILENEPGEDADINE